MKRLLIAFTALALCASAANDGKRYGMRIVKSACTDAKKRLYSFTAAWTNDGNLATTQWSAKAGSGAQGASLGCDSTICQVTVSNAKASYPAFIRVGKKNIGGVDQLDFTSPCK